MKLQLKFLSSLFLYFATAVVPAKIAAVDFRGAFSEVMISIHRGSIAYAAWEDSHSDFSDTLVIGENADAFEPVQLRPRPKLEPAPQPVVERQLAKLIIDRYQTPTVPVVKSVLKAAPETYQELAKALVKAEMDHRLGATLSPKISVSLPGDKRAPTYAKSATDSRKERREYAQNNNDTKKDDVFTNGRERYTISGPVTLTGGAAFVGGNEQIVAFYQRDSRIFSETKVNPNEGTYELETDGLDGEVVAEIRTAAGEILARGKTSLLALAQNRNVSKHNGVEINVGPIKEGLVAQAVSATNIKLAALEGSRIQIAGLNREISYDKVGRVWRDQDFAISSQVIVRADYPNYKPTIRTLEAGIQSYLRLFPAKYVQALLELVMGPVKAKEAELNPVIWGQVKKMGHPLEGARVSLIGEPETKATYFTGYLPDAKRQLTSSNGDFAFVNLDTEEKLLKIEVPGLDIWPIMVSAIKNTVTEAEINIGELRQVEWKSYDAFSYAPVPTSFSALGTDQTFSIGNEGLSYSSAQSASGLTFVEADAAEGYLPIRTLVRPDQTEVHFAQISSEWLKNIAEKKGLPSDKLGRAVVGFVSGDDFEVLLGQEVISEHQKVVYFDSSGQVVTKSGGVAGGGFIVFDLPTGLQTIGILPSRAKTVMSQIIYVDDMATQLVRMNIIL